jgi:hypothetical protein
MISKVQYELVNVSYLKLGIRLAVGQQTLDLHGEVRILYPQPSSSKSTPIINNKAEYIDPAYDAKSPLLPT